MFSWLILIDRGLELLSAQHSCSSCNYLSFFSTLSPLFGSQWTFVHLVGDLNAEGPPVPIPNTEVKLCCGENTCLATDRKDSSLPTHLVGVFNAKGPPVPIPNTEVKLCCGENTCLATDRKNSSMPTHSLPFGMAKGLWFYRNPLKISLLQKSVWIGTFNRSDLLKIPLIFLLSSSRPPTSLRGNLIFLLSSVGRAHDC